MHEKYYEELYDDRATYCNDAKCWEEDMFHLIFTPAGGSAQEIYKRNGDGDITFEDGSKWECSNGGQVLTFSAMNGEFWDSSNHGQVIEYKNAKGDRWDSSNTGQSIEFESAIGEKWESSNHGQVVEYENKDGDEWSGSDNDDIDDMR